MKILFTLFDINDWGGICADLVYKYKGLTEAGHSVDFCFLQDSDRDPYLRGGTTRDGSYAGPVEGMQINTRSGFYGIPIVSYGSEARIKKWYKRAEKYDLVIHEIPGPNPTKVGSLDKTGLWKKLYAHGTPQIISAHDANFRDQYPHLIHIAGHLKGISCTNQAGYYGLSLFPAPRAFIGAPHPVNDWSKQKPWEKRPKRALSAHVWKAWKHMDMTLRAAPFVKDTKLVMAGDGIERAYMTSKDKMKPKYAGVWDAAMAAGVDYRGLVVPDEISKIYRGSRLMIDTSWSKKFQASGCHFNRAIIEGYNNGCVPVVIKENMFEGGFQTQMFKAGVTHLEASASLTSKQFAAFIDHASNIHPDDAEAIVAAGRKILKKYFDYRKSSLDYIKLAEGKPAGVYPKLETGKANNLIKKNAEEFMQKIDALHGIQTTGVSAPAVEKKALF